MYVDPSVLICIEASKRLRQTLQLDAQLNEVVKEDDTSSLFVILLQKQSYGGVRQSVSKSRECLLELVEVDVARAIAIEPSEAILPIRDVLPQSRKLVETDSSCVIPIEHHDH